MKKIMWLSDSPFTNTGYATISRNVLNGVSDEFETNFIGHNYCGQILPAGQRLMDGFEFKFKTFGQSRNAYTADTIAARIQEHRQDVFCILLDTFMTYPWLLDINFAPAKSVFYFPSDGGGGLPQGCENILRHVNVPVAMSKFGKRQVEQQYQIPCEYIPHGVDHHMFRPYSLEEKQRCRREMNVMSVDGRISKGILQGKFVVGCVARNQGRKMLDRELKAFANFCRDRPDAFLLMHTDPYDMAAVFDMNALIVRLKIQNRVGFTGIRAFENFDIKEMPKLYNCMDVFFLSTSGEGFGIPIVEAMSCGVPCVVTDYTTTPEFLIEGGLCGIPVPVAGAEDVSMGELLYSKGLSLEEADKLLENGTIVGNWMVERAVMSITAGTDALQKLYDYPQLREEFGATARLKVEREYAWDVIIPQWKNLFRRMTL